MSLEDIVSWCAEDANDNSEDYTGDVLATIAQLLEVSYSPQIAEALTILSGLQFPIDSVLSPIIIESNA
ncbi:hypothetical protein Ddye_006223 [Dipteronia dyeriana]|uniref:Uncharacterized protein n=1 Tax=Dipteronia dyeriana TaxID=168575 RepID=A0AAD9XI01_9ROSI|nr:hypothetical protein Ddye_006223 [Dipteronia dyeriana]